MSHEGIRFVSKDEAERGNQVERPLPRIAVTPEKVRVLLTEGKGLEIDWTDGHKSSWNFAWLRNACPCATCNEEREGSARKIGQPPKAKPGTLPMYKEPARPLEISPVGKYAINFHWNDGHSSGIYSWDFLRRECPCSECKT